MAFTTTRYSSVLSQAVDNCVGTYAFSLQFTAFKHTKVANFNFLLHFPIILYCNCYSNKLHTEVCSFSVLTVIL